MTAKVRSGWVWLPGSFHQAGALTIRPTVEPGLTNLLIPPSAARPLFTATIRSAPVTTARSGGGVDSPPAARVFSQPPARAAVPITAPDFMNSRLLIVFFIATSSISVTHN